MVRMPLYSFIVSQYSISIVKLFMKFAVSKSSQVLRTSETWSSIGLLVLSLFTLFCFNLRGILLYHLVQHLKAERNTRLTTLMKHQTLFQLVTLIVLKFFYWRFFKNCSLLQTEMCIMEYKKTIVYIEDITWPRRYYAHSWEILTALEDKFRIPKRSRNVLFIL